MERSLDTGFESLATKISSDYAMNNLFTCSQIFYLVDEAQHCRKGANTVASLSLRHHFFNTTVMEKQKFSYIWTTVFGRTRIKQ